MENKTTDSVNVLKAHLALNVTDITKSTEFYRKLFGIEPVKVRPAVLLSCKKYVVERTQEEDTDSVIRAHP